MKKFFDRLQVFLYLAGFNRLATFVGRFGTPALPPRRVVQGADVVQDDDDIHERDTLPSFSVPPGREHLEGPGWRLDEFPPEPLRVIEFDTTFNRIPAGVDMSRDIAGPVSKQHVN